MITESKFIELFCMADDLASQISLNSRYHYCPVKVDK